MVGQVWGIDERKFGHDVKRRGVMFGSLVQTNVWSGTMGMARTREAGSDTSEILEMGVGSRKRNAGIYSIGGGQER